MRSVQKKKEKTNSQVFKMERKTYILVIKTVKWIKRKNKRKTEFECKRTGRYKKGI